MEKQHDTTSLKVRSYRSVLAVGFQHYNEMFRAFFKASWLTALIFALCFGALGTLLLITFPDTLLPIIFLLSMPLTIPLVYAMIRRWMKKQRTFWHVAPGNAMQHVRHCGLIIVVMFTSILMVLLASCVVLLPAFILCLANLQALQGVLLGDPIGMPSMMTLLTLATFTLSAFLLFYLCQPLLVHYFFACGSIDAKEEEKAGIKI